MAESFAKITPPQSRNVHDRVRLFEKIDAARQTVRVIWISAPAGSGKTTLVASYLKSKAIKPVWYQVDEGDADTSSFYYYLGLATKKYAPRSRALPLLTPEYQHGIAAFTRNYFRQLFAIIKNKSILVFDNVQDIGDMSIFSQIIQCLSEEASFNGQVIFISRSKFPANLSRLHLNKHLWQLDWHDMQLTLAESEGVFSVLHAETSHEYKSNIAQIYELTKGWMTGFILLTELNNESAEGFDSEQLLDLEYQEKLFDYFSNELFEGLTELDKTVLLKLAYLRQITAESAIQITANKNAKSVLTALEKNNHFITRKGNVNRPFYEFHPLFRSFLLSHCENKFTDQEIVALKNQTADVSLIFDDYENAARLYSELKVWDKLASLVLTKAAELEQQGRHQLINNWINALPQHVTQQEASLVYWQAIAIEYIDPFAAYHYFEQAFSMFEQRQAWNWCYLSWLGIAETIFLRHDEYVCVSHWMQKLNWLRENSPDYPNATIKAKITVEAFNLSNLAFSGQHDFDYWLAETEKLYKLAPNTDIRCIAGIRLSLYYSFFAKTDLVLNVTKTVARYTAVKEMRPLIRVMTYWAGLTYSWYSGHGGKQETRRLIEAAMQISSEYGVHGAGLWVYSMAIFNSLIFNELDTAQEFIEKYSSMGELRQRLYYSNYLFLLGWYELASGSTQSAIKHLEEARSLSAEINVASFYLLNTDMLVKGYILNGQYDRARQLVEDIREKAAAINNDHYVLFKSSMNLAWINLRDNKRAQAKRELARCFRFGDSERCISGGAWLHIMLAELCEFALAEKIETDYARQLISIYQLKPADILAASEDWPYPIKIYTLGQFRLIKNGEPIHNAKQATRKSLDIIKAIVSMGGVNVNAQALSNTLWPDQEGDAGMNVFTTTLHRLRKFIGQDVIHYANGRISLSQELCWVDVWAVEPQLNRLNEIAVQEVDEQAIKHVDALLKVYQGSFLPADDDESWSLSMRERLNRKLTELIINLCRKLEVLQKYELAKKYYHHGLAIDELHERFYQGLMRCCSEQGLIAEGMAIYHRCVDRLRRFLDVAPSAETDALRARLQG